MGRKSEPLAFRCAQCGGTRHEAGRIQGEGDIKFKSAGGGGFEKHTVFGGKAVSAKRCTDCGYLHLYAT